MAATLLWLIAPPGLAADSTVQDPATASPTVHSVFSPIAASDNPVGRVLRRSTGPQTGAVMRERAIVIQSSALRAALADFAQTGEGRFEVPMFDGRLMIASITEAQRGVHDYLQLTGVLTDIERSYFHLVITSTDVVSGLISSGDELIRIGLNDSGNHAFQQLDSSQFLPELSPRVSSLASQSGEPRAAASARDDGDLVDVLVVYTPQSAASKGGSAAIQAEIDVAMLEANQALLNSGVKQVLRLVGSREVNYTASGDMNNSLDDLTDPTAFGSSLGSAHAWRDQLGADIVVLVTEDANYCGLAWLMNTLSVQFAASAFGIVNKDCLIGGSVLVHELGHIMGLAHNREVNDTVGIYEYAYGYAAPSGDFRTVMAYNTCQNGPCNLINYFSSPLLSFNGQPLGVVAPSPDAANSVRTLNETTPTVAQFRPSRLVTNPKITYPGSGMTLPLTDAGFIWTANGREVDTWQLWLGNQPDDKTLYDSGEITTNTTRTGPLPGDGRIVHATLRYREAGQWRSQPFTFYADNGGVPQMVSPLPGTELRGTTQQFVWNNGGLANTVWTVRVLDTDGTILDEQVRNYLSTSVELGGWSADGQEITLELSFDSNGVSQTQTYQYKTPSAIAAPDLQLTKTVSPTQFNPGDSLNYTFTVTNIGTIALSGVVVTDDKLGGEVCNLRALPIGSAQVCREALYTPTAQEIAAGRVTNSATAIADQVVTPKVAQAIATVSQPDSDIDGITLTSQVTPSTFSRVGEQLTVVFSVTNDSDVPLTEVSITDDALGGIVCTIGSLWTDISTTCSSSYTVTGDDIREGSLSITSQLISTQTDGISIAATISADYADGAITDQTLTVRTTPSLQGSASLDDVITLDIDITNNTVVEHTNIVVADPRLGGTVCIIQSLSPGFNARCTATHRVDRGDVTTGEFTTGTQVTSDQDNTPRISSVSVLVDDTGN